MNKMKKFAKNLLAIIASLAVVLSPVASVSAAPSTIDLGPAKQAGKYIAGVTFSYKFTTDGKYLYCVNMHKNTAQNIKADLVTSGSVVDGGIVYILKNGFPEKSITGDTDKDYYITQTAIWWYLDETTGSQNLGDYFKSTGSDVYGMRKYVKNLVQQGVAHRNDSYGIKDPKLKISTNDNSMDLNGNYYESSNINVTEYANISGYKVTLTGAPAGTIINANGKDISGTTANISGNSSFKIKVPANAVTAQSLSIKVTASATGNMGYTANEYRPRDNSMQSVALLEKAQKSVKSELALEITAASKVAVVKVDSETKQPIAGAVLVLKDSTGKELTRWTSTTNAHVIKNLADGTYTIEEVSAPEGYRLNKNVSTFTIAEGKRNIKVSFENAPKKVVVNITKVDQASGQPLAGAVMVIKDAKGEIVYKWTTTTSSEVITDLENGTYTLEELSAPEGYIKSDKVYTFTIDDDHLSHQITFENGKEVYVPDTASVSSMIMIILGIVITGFGFRYVYKNGQRTR